MGGFPSEVREVLEHFFPLYQEDRERWPLWTYRRVPPDGDITLEQAEALAESSDGEWRGDPGLLPEELARQGITESKTWTGQLTSAGELRWSWAGRLRWSALFPIIGIIEELDRRVQEAGGKLPRGLDNWEVGATVRDRDGSQTDVPMGFVPGVRRILVHKDGELIPIEVPLDLRARTRAAFGATAPTEVPEDPREVSVPRAYTRRGYLDDHDWREVLSCLGMALLRGQPPKLSLFIRRQVEVAKDRPNRAVGWEDPSREKFNELAGQVFEEAGLLPSLQGQTGDKLRESLLRQLHKEALEIVQEVKGHEPDIKVVSGIVSEGATEAARWNIAFQPRFPFLTLQEMQLIRCSVKASAVSSRELANRFPFLEQRELARLYGKGTTPKRAASILLRGRLPSRLSYDGLARRLN